MKRRIILALSMGLAMSHAAYQWKSVQILGGGYVPGAAFHETTAGIAYLRTDVGGAYKLNATGAYQWQPLNDAFTDGNDMGSIAIGLDATDANYLYLTGGLYTDLGWCGGASFLRSSDKGATWTKTALNSTTVTGTDATKLNGKSSLCLAGNGEGRGMGNRIAARGTTIYLGTNQNGLLKSTDRGATWTTVDKTKFSNTSGVSAVLFDSLGTIYAAPYSGGLYKSTDGTTWTPISGIPVTDFVYQMSYGRSNGTIWVTTNSTKPLDQNNVGSGSVYKYSMTSGTIVKITTLPAKGGTIKDYGYLGISVNPKNAQQILVATGAWWKGKDSPAAPATFVPGEAIYQSLDGGATWTDILASGTFDATSAYSAAYSNPHWISALAVDPSDENHVIFGTGYGIWVTKNGKAAKPTWTFSDQGIEETVAMGLVSTKYGAPLVSAIGDIDGYYHSNLDAPPLLRHKTSNGTEAGTNFDMDYAGERPNFLVRAHKKEALGLGGYSINGGKTWIDFATHPTPVLDQYNSPSEKNFIAVSSDASSIVWNMETNGVFFSLDSGKTWKKSTTAASSIAGFRVTADRVTPGTFYIYNAQVGSLYRSTDKGANWTVVNTTLEYGDDWTWGYLRVFASPDKPGDLWITQGAHLYPGIFPDYTGGGLWVGKKTGDLNVVYHSTDGGVTLNTVTGLATASSIGFGKGTGTSSAIYAIGVGSTGKEGVFRSVDNGLNWTKIDDAAHQYGGMKSIIGDPCVFSRVYITVSGRGIVYGEEGTNANACVDRVENGGPTLVRSKSSAEAPQIQIHGNMILANQNLELYSVQGTLVKRSLEGRISIAEIPNGIYIVRSEGKSLRILVQDVNR